MDIQKLFSALEEYIFKDSICLMGIGDRFDRDKR